MFDATSFCKMSCLEKTGALFLGIIALRLIAFVGCWFLRKLRRNALDRLCKPGDYAIVTGATDGIGLQYAKQLAQRGFKLLLISRSEEKLRRVAETIQQDTPQCAEIQTLAVDFSREDIYDTVEKKVKSLGPNISVLVNNVGMANTVPEFFLEYSPDFNRRLINTNIMSATVMSEIVLKPMVKLGRGVVINLSSIVGLSSYPMFATYAASKAYINSLSSALATELKQHNIVVQTVTPNQVVTNMTRKMLEPTVAVPVEDYVRYAMDTVGRERQTNAHPRHKFVAFISEAVESFIGYNLSMWFKLMVLKNTRKRADANAARNN